MREDLRKLALTKDLAAAVRARDLPRRRHPVGDSCRGAGPAAAGGLRPDRQAAPEPGRLGPATFLYQAVAQIAAGPPGPDRARQQTAQRRRAGRAARRRRSRRASEASSSRPPSGRARRCSAASSEICSSWRFSYGLTRPPTLDDPEFVSRVVFDPSRPAGTPKERFAYLFPSPDAAPDLGPAAPRADRLASATRRSTCSARRSPTRASSSRRRLRGQRRARGRRRRLARELQSELFLLLGGGRGGDGPDAARDLLAAAAAAAARRRAGGRRRSPSGCWRCSAAR